MAIIGETTLKITAVKNNIHFREIDGDGGYFSMRNLGKTYEEYSSELISANRKYLEEQNAKLKAERLEALKKSIEGKNLNLFEKLIYNFKKIKINLL
jgi:hypothetical protein